ncbi:MAG: methylated-DNA--[protein]-cysteine S-methyltransferase [Thermoleophilia bacterium]
MVERGGQRVVSHRYEVPGWGVGELWLADGRVVWHDAPAARPLGRDSGHPLARRLAAWFAGAHDDFLDVELAEDELSPFGQRLCTALRRVPRGSVVSYGELAGLAGRPRAARAAGTFCARNRFAVLVPCHRVVAADGPGSYGDLGLDYKLRLLALEGWTPG